MNGMTRKKLRREHAKKYDAEGLPRDARDWTFEDWRDLHRAMEQVKRKVAARRKRA